MSVIKINAITVPADSGDELAHRFAARAGAVDGQPGFEGFELLKPTDEGRRVWLVVTRWKDEESFQAWVNSKNFAEGHAHGGEAPAGHGHGAGEGHRKPVGLSAELWGYEVAGGSTGHTV
ncbi:antibiotic biosynthesis monooxygenase family protein [Mobilicoccus pelagius]|uniref:ABM domain-containing protein n=1 Tax=Mobilicoccus pelagius NBRC 104925 TaxID=1089455 RepID=H5USM1_9MICO|nr:antibiotic biosynthesis monooxygenase [Mobilicoccus pelagius]GAB48729.1 hypothetical protein MOPEL_080_00080 [Mobilicoccus pelagius NBRC 104925]